MITIIIISTVYAIYCIITAYIAATFIIFTIIIIIIIVTDIRSRTTVERKSVGPSENIENVDRSKIGIRVLTWLLQRVFTEYRSKTNSHARVLPLIQAIMWNLQMSIFHSDEIQGEPIVRDSNLIT